MFNKPFFPSAWTSPGRTPRTGRPYCLYDCNDSGAQRWTVGADGTIRALGKCLDVTGGGTTDGTAVEPYDCNDPGAPRWTVTGARDVVNPQAGKCLDATGDNSANGTRLRLRTRKGGVNRKWTVG